MVSQVKVLSLSQRLSAIQIKAREVCPALFNDRLSRYLIHKLNCCFTCLSISGLSCCGNKQTLNGAPCLCGCEGLVPVLVTHHSSHTNKCQGARRENCHQRVEGGPSLQANIQSKSESGPSFCQT